ncbi:zinc finger and SCAN domain-containing protein 12-like [Toxorhynchites rutilus septentrionalis]|uniref:zinc finger and SCAN domain-containing protein 12-like n=1 Tax=Toxorhynchites rutilus septentrionalis TaxID=329112 RepID=UPI0024795358|nr:zinc finger and SCAN domain-containing protein 12-like [Toxorhynchites rutilus septentrionalis]
MSVCRVCLSQDYYEYYSLFSVRDKRTIAKAIMVCTGIQIKRQDGLTQLICGFCTEEFLKFFKLRQQCLEADAYLREKLQAEHNTSVESEDVLSKNVPHDDSCNVELQVDSNAELQLADLDNKGTYSSNNGDYPESNVLTEEWVVEETDAVKEEYEVLASLGDPGYSDVDENSGTASESEEDIKPAKRKQLISRRPRKQKLIPHLEAETEASSRFVCCSCPSEIFESQQAFEAHRTDQHKKYRIADNVIRPYECEICFQRFLTEKHLAQHKARPYKKREYVCTSCGNAFLARSTLKKHEEICITTERNYACEECGKRFTQVGSLRNHLKLHNSEKTHSCPICAKTFLKKFEVPIHMVTHTEEQPFPCDQCPARFKRKQALRNHQRHHSNPTPYKCDLCDEWFNNFSARKFHRQKVHEGIEPFKCDQCGASYGRKNRLDQHIKRMHAGGGA